MTRGRGTLSALAGEFDTDPERGKIAWSSSNHLGLCALTARLRRRDITVQRPHHPDARKHRRAVVLDVQEQCFDGGLPVIELTFCLRQFLDISGGVFEGDKPNNRAQARVYGTSGEDS